MEDMINYSISERKINETQIITVKIHTGIMEKGIDEVRVYWDDKQQILIEIREYGITQTDN
ncbi:MULTISPECIES: hypothetical protein [Bacillota]|uniref:hypothetical protein n=1 Tax=Bacillota TaxID=1239 RepID=UPI0015609871|nr:MULTISPECIES: hypothetical protein [Bacillota]NRG29480.1 hypothetical protein [Niallia circulans]